ncbi:DUF2381 family protein [Myxococcus dinghuensis]|uniref:DUF2381 family protein n=1 Tax=Myxococcus dinghuensis TaxID=2906761 RepID=UPI0038996E2D
MGPMAFQSWMAPSLLEAVSDSLFARVAGLGEFALLRPVALLFFLLSVAASAQPAPTARERQDRRVVLSNGAAPVPELRVAAGFLTNIVFEAPLDRGSVEVEGRERFRLVDVGERVLALEPAADLGPGERLGLRVRFAAGAAQGQGIFVLVSHPGEVDARVEVFRQQDSVELLRAELVEARAQLKAQAEELQAVRALRATEGPTGLILSGMLNGRGLKVRHIQPTPTKSESRGEQLKVENGTTFRASTWAAITVEVRNLGANDWTPTSARVVNSQGGTSLDALSIRMALPRIEPNKSGRVVIETEVPPWPPGESCVMELRDRNGAVQASVHGVAF